MDRSVLKFGLTANSNNITIDLSSTYPLRRIIFRNLNFINWGCGSTHPYFDIPSNLCYDTACPAGNYRVGTISCLPCLYDCETCINGTSC